VPNSSDSCARVCEILLLLELLRRQRPDLSLEQGESLLSLVGGRRERRVPPLKSVARAVIRAGLAAAKVKTVPDLLTAGLDLAPVALPPQLDPAFLVQRSIMGAAEDLMADPLPRVSKAQLQAEFRKDVFEVFKKRARQVVSPLRFPFFREREVMCMAVLPFAPALVASDNSIVRAAGALALAGCGIEIQSTGPQAGIEAFKRRSIAP